MASARLLLVDDDEAVLSGLTVLLEAHEFEVTTATNVVEALRHITTQDFDVLLSDLHMPGPGDGLTVVSAMRHAHPAALTILLSAFPDMAKASAAIVKQADEVVQKPVKGTSIVELIQLRLKEGKGPPRARAIESAAAILERASDSITETWLRALGSVGGVGGHELTVEERTVHLPDALRDIIFRLRYPQPAGSKALYSMAALQHGARRRRQGIGAATLVEESRALQGALFDALQRNIDRIDLGELPDALMAIADEVNAQLLQAVEGYENEQPVDVPWGFR